MDRIDFALNGKKMSLTRDEVLTVAANLEPQPSRTWAFEAGGRLFPVKQVFGAATRVSHGEFTSHRARDLLRRIGFRVYDLRVEQPDAAAGPAQSQDGRTAGDSSIQTARIAALRAAARVGAARPTMDVQTVLVTAARFEDWLLRPTSAVGLDPSDPA